MSFLLKYWDVIAFYSLAVILIYLFRSKFEFQGIVALLRTKFGLNFMTNTGKRHPVFWNRVAWVSIVLGFIGMVFITGYLFYGVYQLIFVPSAPPVLSPVIPGVKIPGVPITFPLWYTLIGLFFAVIVHEATHGIFASSYGIKIKSSGFAFIGPIPGAFVEPDENVMNKRPKRQQLAILSGGPFANVVLAIVAFAIALGIGTLATGLTVQQGVHVQSIANDSGAQAAGMHGNITITEIDGTQIRNLADLTRAVSTLHSGESINVTADNTTYTAVLGVSPDNKNKPYLGILTLENNWSMKNDSFTWLYNALVLILNAFIWIYIIALGIGIANLLPIGPVDGGRMFLITLTAFYKNEKKAKAVWNRWSILLLIIILVVVFVPIIKAII